MGFNKIHSIQVRLVLHLVMGSIYPHYHVVYDDIFSEVVSIIAADPYLWIRLVI